MRCAILLVCLFVLPGMAYGQVGPIYGPPADRLYPSNSGQLYFRPKYRYGGTFMQELPRATTTGNVWNNRPDWRGTGPIRHHARYSYYPQYPGLMYSNRPDIRPDVYVVPPVSVTPYHDPYFEERIWDDDDYQHWGW